MDYKPIETMRALLPRVLTRTPKGHVNVDLRLYARTDPATGRQWAEVAFLDRRGRLLHSGEETIVLSDRSGEIEALPWFMRELFEDLLDAAAEKVA